MNTLSWNWNFGFVGAPDVLSTELRSTAYAGMIPSATTRSNIIQMTTRIV